MSVSFIATFYNKAAYIPAVLDAIASQRGILEREFIFIDDGSTDNTLEILREMTRGWVGVKIIAQDNTGPAIATNNAIGYATKDYIKLWDGDDIAHPDTTRLLLQAMEQHKTGFAYCGIDFAPFGLNDYNTDKDAFYADIELPQHSHVIADPIKFILKGPFANPTALLFRTDLLRVSGGADPTVFIQDYALSLRAAHLSALAHVPQTLAFAFKDVDHRLSGNEAQILHDLNAALYNYACGDAPLHNDERRYLSQRMAGRAWKWAHRHHGAGLLSGAYRRFVKSKLKSSPLSREDLYKCLLPFREKNTIRTRI